ncbi:MAG: hypothetical protein AAGD34_21100, partial [Pseudomonadota bacterium]
GTVIDPLSPRGIEALIDAMAAHPLVAPTHFGTDERRQTPLDANGLRDTVAGLGSNDFLLAMKRGSPPRLDGHIDAMAGRRTPAGLSHVKLRWSRLAQAHRAEVFAFGTHLAEALEAQFALIHPMWDLGDTSQAYSAAGIVVFDELQRFGPPGVAAVTVLGPHLVALFGRERLLDIGVPVRPTPWGGITLSLVDNPAAADFDALQAAQSTVMEALAPAEVFATIDVFDQTAGPNWVPIPQEACG